MDRKSTINGIMDASVKLPINMAVKVEETEADVLKIIELLSSPHDQPSSVNPGHVPGKRKCWSCCWHCLSPSQQEDCLAKMVFSGRKLAFSTISKYRELVTSS